MRYRQPLQNKQQNASVLLQQLQLQKQRMEDKLNNINEDTDYLLQLQKMTNMKLCKHNPNTPIPNLIASVAPHTFATIQPKISSGDYIKNKKMNALFNNQTFISCFVNNDNQKVNTKPILTQEEYVLYKDSLSSNCHSNRCDLRYKPYSNGSLISNLYTYQDLSGVDVIVEASAGSLVSSSTIYDNYIIDPDQVLFGTQATSTLFEYQKCKKNDTFTKQISSTPQIVNLTADVSGSCNEVSVVLKWSVFSLQTYYITEYDVYKNDVLYATVQNNTYTFVGLPAGTPDTFKVIAHNNCGDASLPVEITPEYPPSTPEITTITYDIVDYKYNITVNWNPSSYPGNTEESVSYHVYYNNLTPAVVVSYDVLSHTFVGLPANVSYTFYLYASNTWGSSCIDQMDFIPTTQPFTFTYRTTNLAIDRNTILTNLPFITSGGNLTLYPPNILTTITPYDAISMQVVVNIPEFGAGYTFTDTGTTDGLCFNATTDIHNYYFTATSSGTVLSITINWFGDIPISRGGSQFGYNDIVANAFTYPFLIDPVSNTNAPSFLTNTSFNYAFCNLVQFNSFIGFWNTTNVISGIGTFKNCLIFNNGH